MYFILAKNFTYSTKGRLIIKKNLYLKAYLCNYNSNLWVVQYFWPGSVYGIGTEVNKEKELGLYSETEITKTVVY